MPDRQRLDQQQAEAEAEKRQYDQAQVCENCGSTLGVHHGWDCPPLSPARRTRRGRPTYRGPLIRRQEQP